MAINVSTVFKGTGTGTETGTGRVGVRQWVRIESMQSLRAMELVNQIDTTQLFIIDKQIGDFGYPQQTSEGLPSALDSKPQLYEGRITPVEYTLMFGITKLAEFTDQYGIFDDYKNSIRDAFKDLHSLAVCNLFNNAFDTTNFAGFDTKSLCHTGHLYKNYPTWSNRGDASGNDMALSYDGVAKARTQMRNVRTARQRPMRMDDGVTLLVPTALEYKALAIEKSVTRPDTANRETNVVTKGNLYTQVEEDLSSTTAWFLVNRDKKKTGLTWLQQMPIDILTKDFDVRTRTKFVSFFESFATYFNKAHGVWGTTGG